MKQQKCELCGRSSPQFEIEKIDYDGNTFQACEVCRDYLSTDYTIDDPIPSRVYITSIYGEKGLFED